MNPVDNKVVDLMAFKAEAKKVKELLKTDTSALSQKELSMLVQSLGKLVDQQTALLNQMMLDMTLLTHNFAGMQNQFLLVSGQAYVALELLKEKSVCTPEDIDAKWQAIENRINGVTAPLTEPDDLSEPG